MQCVTYFRFLDDVMFSNIMGPPESMTTRMLSSISLGGGTGLAKSLTSDCILFAVEMSSCNLGLYLSSSVGATARQ